jgi:uncharacterized protein YabN with tetrapyrrole methylase and pyrophosphatase domain
MAAMNNEEREFWADEMAGLLSRLPAAELLAKAQNAAVCAGHEFYGGGQEKALADLQSEAAELVDAIQGGQSPAHIRNEVGDVIFCLINLCRLHGIDFGNALEKVTERWLTRKSMQEQRIREAGYNWRTVPGGLRQELWREVKVELSQREYAE